MRFLILSAAVLLAGCKLEPLKIDPCALLPETETCYAVPINQPGRQEYVRPLNHNPPDICVTSDEYARTQKAYRELMRLCGDRCK
jgi:hypothetical protein